MKCRRGIAAAAKLGPTRERERIGPVRRCRASSEDEDVPVNEDERLRPHQKKAGCPVAPYRVFRRQPSRIGVGPGTLRSAPGTVRSLPRGVYGRVPAQKGLADSVSLQARRTREATFEPAELGQ